MGKRKVEKVKSSAESAIEDAKSEIESLKDELQSWYDNLPEQFQSGDKGSQLEEAISQLENVEQYLEEVDTEELPTDLEEFEYVLPNRKTTSRAKRLENVMAGIEAAHDTIQTKVDELGEEKDEQTADIKEILEPICDSLQSALDEAQSVEFPGMY